MVFSSMTFLWIFLPIVLMIYYGLSFIKNQKYQILGKNIKLNLENEFIIMSELNALTEKTFHL